MVQSPSAAAVDRDVPEEKGEAADQHVAGTK